MSLNSKEALESFINTCDELMIPAEEGTYIDITKEMMSLKKRIKELEKELKDNKDADSRTKIRLMNEIKKVLDDTKKVIASMPDAESDTWRKVLGCVVILFTPIFVGIPAGVAILKSVHCKRDALKWIDDKKKAIDSRINVMKDED